MAEAYTHGDYYEDLAEQTQINEEQLGKLEDILFIQRIKAIFYLVIGALIFCVLTFVIFALLSGAYFIERYSALINIAAVFLLFGLIEMFAIFLASLSIIRQVRRLIKRQFEAIKAAHSELSAG